MQVLIIEDELLGLERLQTILTELDAGIVVAGSTDSVRATVQWLRENPAPDLIFMDIELADGQCFDIFKQIEVPTPVIFTTSYDEYALAAFKVNSVDYLLKPIRKDDLRRSIEKYRHMQRHFGAETRQNVTRLIENLQRLQAPTEYRKRFLVRQGQRLLAVETEEIAWFMAEDKLCFLRTWDKRRYLVDYTLEELAEMLDPALFYRANRSYMVHVKSVKSIEPYFNGKLLLRLSPPAEPNEALVSKEKATDFKKWMGK